MIMPEPAGQEKGHLYKAEKPSSFNKGQTGKGASIGGKVTAKGGEKMEVSDAYAKKLRKIWNKAEKAHGKFPPF
jgi:hypothetical protein